VARFTFATGNVKKVLALPLYGLGALASLVVPRSNGLWAFGSGSGVGEGSLALLRYARTANPALRTVWLTRNDRDAADARSLGIASAPAQSPRGFWLTLRSRVVVVTHGFGDANRFGVQGAYVVQLWHGIPFKHIHLDSPATLQLPVLSRFALVRRAIRSAYVRSARGIRLFATASPIAAARIRTAFDLPADRVVVTGDPRDDVLATETRAGARAKVAALLGEQQLAKHLLLYAPTWRDGDEDPLIPTAADWDRIIDYLAATDSVLLIRSHPLGAGDYSVGAELSPRIRMLGADLQGDINPLLPAMDTLITDYSSIAFDYSLVGGPMIFLVPDVLVYSSTRGAYEPFSDFTGGYEVVDWAGAIALLRERDASSAVSKRMTEHTHWLARRAFSFTDGRNAERVYDEIVARLERRELPVRDVPPLPLVVDSLDISDDAAPTLTVAGRHRERPPFSIQLAGPRVQLNGILEVTGDEWTATVPLLTSRLGGPSLPPPSGRYTLRFSDDQGRLLDATVEHSPADPGLRVGLFRYAMPWSSVGVTIDFTPPLSNSRVGARNQARLQ
jgi:CDP-glycerol glycerophosphotransferase